MKYSAICQLDCYKNKFTEKYKFLNNYCIPSVKYYCDKHNIQYNIIQYDVNVFTYSEKIKLFNDIVLNQGYNQVLFLDLDIFISKNSPNIFNLYIEHLGGCMAIHQRFLDGLNHIKKILGSKISPQDYTNLLNCSIRPNSGVLLFNRSNIPLDIFNYNYIENSLYEDEPFLSYKIANRNLSYTILPSVWNNRNLSIEYIYKSYFTHILTNLFDNEGYDKYRNIYLKNIVPMIQNFKG